MKRDAKNGMIAGVCAGIANHFKLDANLVRIIAILLGLFLSWGVVIVYALCWMFLPTE